MVDITPAPAYIRNLVLKVGANTFSKAVTSAAFEGASSIVTFKGGTPDAKYSQVVPTQYTFNLTAAQDWTTANSLSRYLYDNDGKSAIVEYTPVEGGPKFTANVTLVAPSIGGAVDAYATFTVSMPCDAKPTISAAV